MFKPERTMWRYMPMQRSPPLRLNYVLVPYPELVFEFTDMTLRTKWKIVNTANNIVFDQVLNNFTFWKLRREAFGRRWQCSQLQSWALREPAGRAWPQPLALAAAGDLALQGPMRPYKALSHSILYFCSFSLTSPLALANTG